MAVSSKVFFLESLLAQLDGAGAPSILELGCGTASYVDTFLSAHPEVKYVGVEPYEKSFREAEKNLAGHRNATLFHQSGCEAIPEVPPASFDVVFSLSALEHVKYLDAFLKRSVEYAKPGGHIVHRYDLGHALYPSSLKERFQVFLGNHAPQVLPEGKFVRYVDVSEVRESLKRHGVTGIEQVTYHQMPNHKTFSKYAQGPEFDVAKQTLLEWERGVSPLLEEIETPVRERLFPTIGVWARK